MHVFTDMITDSVRGTLLLNVHILLLAIVLSTKTPFTCEAGDYFVGENVSVTCHFGHDISDHDFEIMWYPFKGTSNDTGVEVLLCIRLTEKIDCVTKNGIDFDHRAQENVTVTIRNVTKTAEGHYACQLVPSDDRPRLMCNLTVKARPSPATPTTDGDSSGNKGVTLLVSTILMFLSISMLCFAFVHFYRYRYDCPFRRSKTRSRTSNTAEEFELTEPFTGPDLQK